MPPQTKNGYPSVTDNPAGVKVTSAINVYPAQRDHMFRTPEIWLQGKKEDDAVHPYWRIYDKLYDFTEFIDTHPGGKFWLEDTRGMDITESFETSHFSNLPEKMLDKYFVRNTNAPRTTSFTFNEDGFYKTLKRKAVKILKENGGTSSTNEMKFVLDSLVVSFFVFMFLAATFSNYYFAILSGISLACAGTAAHNFFHMKDNWRMYAFDLSIMSSRDWRISHALSHHVFPNTIYDFEVSGVEPLFQFFPSNKKSLLYQVLLIPNVIIFMPLNFHLEWLKNIGQTIMGKRKLFFSDFFPILELIAMLYINGTFWATVKIWFIIHMTGNFIIHFFGLQASHHHARVYHEGDRFPNDKDWGLFQVFATRERGEVFFQGPLFLIAISFGNHTLHHLFPTCCHSKLFLLQDVFLETCKEFGIHFAPNDLNPLKLFFGYFYCLFNKTPNKELPFALQKKKDK